MLKVYKDFAAIVGLPVFVIVLAIYFFGLPMEEFENFVKRYSGTIISLGTLALVSLLALLTSHISNKAADRRDALAAEASHQREALIQRVQSELQVSQFRQAWISEMRDDIIEYSSLAFHRKGVDDITRMFALRAKIEMRLNTEEPLARELSKNLNEAFRKAKSDEEIGAVLGEVTSSGRAYLKAEWARLKDDLRKAQLLDEADQ
ncbi:MAG: hypothetical protein OQK05_10475 [Pseudopelagicola sp.]|nr:hypothetical protein [Pseudopelagicola sp.]